MFSLSSLKKTWLFVTCLLVFITTQGFADLARDPSFMGEYEGIYKADKISTLKASAKVVSEGPGLHDGGRSAYRVVLKALPRHINEEGLTIEIYGVQMEDEVVMFGHCLGRLWRGTIKNGRLVLESDYYGMAFELEKKVRKSGTEGIAPPKGAVVVLPYEPGKAPDLSAWTNQTWKALKDGSMERGVGDTQTKQKFGDLRMHMEFMLPLEPLHFDQYKINSGVFLAGAYEVQILDSFGIAPSMGDCGAVYGTARPRVNASLPPLRWQTYDITFKAARFDEHGDVTELPRITVVHNCVVICEDIEIEAPNTPDPHPATGPIKLQDARVLIDYGKPVKFRNIWVVEIPEQE